MHACVYVCLDCMCACMPVYMYIQPIADRVAQNLAIITRELLKTRRTKFSYELLSMQGSDCKSHRQNSGLLERLEIPEVISRFCATLFAIGCMHMSYACTCVYVYTHCMHACTCSVYVYEYVFSYTRFMHACIYICINKS